MDDGKINFIGDMHRLQVRPGDVFVIQTTARLPREHELNLRDYVSRALGNDAKVLVLTDGLKLGVVGNHVSPSQAFDEADWFWRTMDPDDSGDSPSEALNVGMVGRFCVCEVGSSYTGPTRFGFIAPVEDPDSDDEEFLHFDTQAEAVEAARLRSASHAARNDEGRPVPQHGSGP